jgi:hypothetical protein
VAQLLDEKLTLSLRIDTGAWAGNPMPELIN